MLAVQQPGRRQDGKPIRERGLTLSRVKFPLDYPGLLIARETPKNPCRVESVLFIRLDSKPHRVTVIGEAMADPSHLMRCSEA